MKKRIGRHSASIARQWFASKPRKGVTACRLVFIPPLVRPIRRPRRLPSPLFPPEAGRLSVSRVDLTDFGTAASQASPSVSRAKMPVLPHRFQRLQRVFGSPYSFGASHHRKPLRLVKIMPLRTRPLSRFAGKPLPGNGIIDSRHAMALREERPKPGHLCVRQPEKIAHHHPHQFGGLNHAAGAESSRSMGPDPRADSHQRVLLAPRVALWPSL